MSDNLYLALWCFVVALVIAAYAMLGGCAAPNRPLTHADCAAAYSDPSRYGVAYRRWLADAGIDCSDISSLTIRMR